MGQVLHGSATTTEAIRRAIQNSQESLEGTRQALWRQPEDCRQVEEAGFGPPICRPARRRPKSSVLSDRGGGDHRCLPAPYVAAAGRLPLLRCTLLAARRLVPGLEFHVAQLLGVQGRPCPCVALALHQQMPDHDGEFARGCDGCDMLAAAGPDAQEEGPQRSRRACGRPGRLDEHAARMSAALLGDPPW